MKNLFFIILFVIVGSFPTIAQCTADFDRNPNTVCVGEPVVFYDLSTGGSNPKTWNWNFGPGATPATFIGQNPPIVIYSTTGTKTTTLTYTSNGGGCTDVQQRDVDVIAQPTASFTSNSPQCVGQQFNYTYTGSAALTFAWDFGIGATPSFSNIQNPQGIIYSSAGSKTITLTIDNGTCTRTITQSITVSATPTASFVSTAPSCTGINVDFTNLGTITGTTWAWNLGSGATPATSTSQDPLGIVYSTSGTKVITLITTNNSTGCAATSIQTLNINQTPDPAFSSNSPQCEGAAITLAYTGSTFTGWTYNWDFGTGANPATSNAQIPGNITYAGPGTKTISITATNGVCSKSFTGTISINQSPISLFSYTAPSCTADSVSFLNTGTTGSSYAWNFGSGATPISSITENPSGIVYSSSGIKTVQLITTLGNCTATSNQTIDIKQTPAPSFTSNSPQCEGSNVNLNYTGTAGLGWTYNWDFGTGALPSTSSAQVPGSIIYTVAGTKTITLTVSNDICSKTITGTISINLLPSSNAGKDTTICANTSVQIGSANQVGFTYNWFPPSTLTSTTISNPVASPIAPVTIYIVTMTNTVTGCVAQDSSVVTMLSPLVANAGIDAEICRYDSIQIGVGLVDGQTYNWSPNSGLSNSNLPNPISTPEETTTYTLTVNGSGCGPVTDEVTIIVHPLPLANAGLNDTITVGSSIQLIATGGVQYAWSPGYGLDNIGIFNPIANPDTTTEYIVTVTDIYGCVKTDTLVIKVIVPNFWLPNAFTPNGNGRNDVLYVRGEGIKDFQFGIFNRWGEQVFYSKDIKSGWDGKKNITGEEMPEGAYAYFIKGVLSNGEPVNQKGLVNLVR